jgi:hypothetical protein
VVGCFAVCNGFCWPNDYLMSLVWGQPCGAIVFGRAAVFQVAASHAVLVCQPQASCFRIAAALSASWFTAGIDHGVLVLIIHLLALLPLLLLPGCVC